MNNECQIFNPLPSRSPPSLPLFSEQISAGFPSPAENYIENSLDLNELVIKHPASTFFVRVQGDSMIEARIFSGDILVVDRSLEAHNGKIIVAVVNGEFTVKKLVVKSGGAWLEPANLKYAKTLITPELEFQVWGVVSYVIHQIR